MTFGENVGPYGSAGWISEADALPIMPSWTAYEMRLMAERYVSDGMIPEDGDRKRLVDMLGRPLHDYRETARAIATA